MKLYHPTKGLKGIRGMLNQFNEAVLTEWQRDILRERLLILRWYGSKLLFQAANAEGQSRR